MSKNKTKIKYLKIALKFILLIAIVFIGFFASIYLGLFGKLASEKELADLNQVQASKFIDRNDQTFAKIYELNRESISIDALPQHLLDALIATEDARFYEHSGIDTRSLMRVLFKTILAGDESSGGGSTITLQLAKNLFGRKDYSFLSIPINKTKEAIVAQRIEDVYTKREILELYLNIVPFSGNTYGIESASQKFFNKSAADLQLPEAAILVGTLKANHSYNPRLFPERSQLRRDVVITQMLKYEMISKQEADAVMVESLEIDYSKNSSKNSYYLKEYLVDKTQEILDSINAKDNKDFQLKKDGLIVKTTIDAGIQDILESNLKEHLKKIQSQFESQYASNKPWENPAIWKPELRRSKAYQKLIKNKSEDEVLKELSKKRKTEFYDGEQYQVVTASTIDSIQHHLKFLNAASLSIDPHSGDILAYVGGLDQNLSQYDFIRYAKRQVGSTFKPIVYASALNQGLEPCDYLSAKEISYKNYDDWKPKNASKKDEIDPHLNYSLKSALTQSLNVVSVKVLEEAGIQNTIDFAKKLKIKSVIKPEPSMALGAVNMNIKELALAYSGFVADEIPNRLNLIKSISTIDGKIIYEAPKTQHSENPLDEFKRLQMLAMLQNVVKAGTGRAITYTYGLRQAIAGKTGTTQDNKDGWFVGVTPHYINVNWVGHNNQKIGFKTTRLGQGAVSALPIFAKSYAEMINNSEYNAMTRAKFKGLDQSILKSLACEDTKRDGFFKRLFSNKKDEKEFESKREEEKKKKKKFLGIF
ncbi:MAG: transglycosylase domain-containing protein [Psychroflexus halocasei]